MRDVDVAIVGAGVVGLACAQALASRATVAVLERRPAFGLENSSHNSGVIHAGIYYPTGSLKHRLCIEGNRLLYAWCAAHGVRTRRCGKLIIAVDETERAALRTLHAQASANGVPDLEMIEDSARLRELEPAVRCVAALWSGTTGVVDAAGLMASLAAAAQARHAIIATRHAVTAIARTADGFALSIVDADGVDSVLRCGALVNSAGLNAPAVAAMLGYPLDGKGGIPVLRQRVNKGRYYDIVNPALARSLRHLVYPVPEHARGGLGVHVTLDIDGGAHLGPDTEWLDEGAPLDFRSDDARRTEFVAAARRYLPALRPEDLAPGQVGYRPKLQTPGREQADFLIWQDRGYVHLGGIESPGLTAALAIGRYVADVL